MALVQAPQFRTAAHVVVVPVTVMDSKGRRVAGLQKADFELLDQGNAQTFQLEEMNAPVSLVVAVETAATSAAALEKVRKMGGMFEPLLAGSDGEVGLIAYDNEVRVLSELAHDGDEFGLRMKHLQVMGGGGRMHDAVAEAVRMLRVRPTARRRVLVLIGESKDLGSELKLDRAVSIAQQANVSVYPLTYSRTATPFTSKEPIAGNMGLDLLGGLRELVRLGKANSAAELARFTGGWTNAFVKQNGLQEAIQRISEDLHLQYLLTFEAKGVKAGEYRGLEVRVVGRPGYRLRHRPGYWVEGAGVAG